MRDPLDKEKFFEGNRQRWAAIFLGCGAIVLFVNVYIGVAFDPTAYMQFLLAIGSLFILGASGDSWVKAYSVKSIKQTEISEETKRITVDKDIKNDSLPNTNIIMSYQSQYSKDASYAPLEWVSTYE